MQICPVKRQYIVIVQRDKVSVVLLTDLDLLPHQNAIIQ